MGIRRAKFNLNNNQQRPRVRQQKPTWRYDYVSDLLDEHCTPSRKDDYYVHELYKLMDKIRNGRPDELQDYEYNNPDIADALTLFEQGITHCTDIHCRFIAGYSYDEISTVLGVEPRVIEFYIKCFFDIEDHRENLGYINRFVIQPMLKLDSYSEEALWLKVASVGGKEMIQLLENSRPDQTRQFFEMMFDNMLLCKGIQAVGGLKPNSHSATEVITTLCNKIENRKRLEALEGAQMEEDNWMSQMASMVLKTFAFGIVSQQNNLLPADPSRSGKIGLKELEQLHGDNMPDFVENIVSLESDNKSSRSN